VSAGGSSFFDVVAEVLAEERVTDRIVLRSGCYVTHDAAHYERLSPFASLDAPRRFRSAIEVWGAVLSRPEPELAIVGVGRRDVPFDQGPPTPLFTRAATGDTELGDRMVVERLNDQHAFCRIEPALPLAPGDRVAFGISHPCTAFDKWRVIPVLADDDRVVDAVATYF
jgi:D-serine deaminase-like pyridoxal phosphate-dependent protein